MLSGRLGRALLLVVAALVGAGVTFAILNEPEPPPREPVVPATPTTCERAFAAADAINAYLTERSGSDPGAEIPALSDLEEEERETVWAEYLAETSAHSEETVSGFVSTFGGEVQFLVNRLAELNAWPAEEPEELVVVNELAIQRVATNLDTAALEAGCNR